jgi:hypothetical protein
MKCNNNLENKKLTMPKEKIIKFLTGLKKEEVNDSKQLAKNTA